jgi:hypothetical protein
VTFARERGARAVEGYPITTKNVILEELHVGLASHPGQPLRGGD